MAKPNTKQLVFISHIEEEKQVAYALKELVEATFLGMIETFVSSDPDSIEMGRKWLETITAALKRCAVEIVIASPVSVQRPWVNFEAGAAYIRDVPVVPICHSGLPVSQLKPPLSHLQAANATIPEQLGNVFRLLAKSLDCTLPVVDYSPFIATVEEFQATTAQLEQAAEKSLIGPTAGLEEFEVATLVAAAECTLMPGNHVYPNYIRERLTKAEYTEIAGTLGLAGLSRKGFIDTVEVPNDDRYGPAFDKCCVITDKGWHWLSQNHRLFSMKFGTAPEPPAAPPLPTQD